MDILELMGDLEREIKYKDLWSNFLKEKETEIKDSILDLWKKFSADNITILEKKEEMINNDVSADKTEITHETKEISKTEDKNKPVLSQDDNTRTDRNCINPISEKVEQSKDKNINFFELLNKNKSIIIPNGKINQEYCYLFKIEELGFVDFGDYWFEGLETIGLIFNPNTHEIKGKPIVAGDHIIKLKIKRNDWVDGKPIFERQITLTINPDPKSLWKNEPTPIDIEYYKPDSDKLFIKVEGTSSGSNKTAKKHIVAASQRGRSHAQESRPRDDDFAIHYIKEYEWYIMAVADGAGSAIVSRKGSEIACRTVVDVCRSMINNTAKDFEHQIKEFNSDKSDVKRKVIGDNLYKILGNAIFKAVKKIEEESKLANKPLRDYATTLIVSICKKFKFGWFVGAFWVGDGGIGIYNKENRFINILGESDGGEYAGQTRFLTMSEIIQPTEIYRRLRFDLVDNFTALILMTDGISDPKFETDANLLKVEKWDALWQDLSKEVDFSEDNETIANQLLNWLDFWSPGNHDDRTIAILF
ncbi:MAG: PP2C family serine/threonine-protein phosphatase [Candidatus Paceibacterota bacterium]|jgi:serine/threonine protein phosphatase PrpC